MRRETPWSALPHLVSLLEGNETQKQPPFCRREVGNKTVIRTDLCMTKYITYIPTYRTKLNQLVK